jgi:hypothetical protein
VSDEARDSGTVGKAGKAWAYADAPVNLGLESPSDRLNSGRRRRCSKLRTSPRLVHLRLRQPNPIKSRGRTPRKETRNEPIVLKEREAVPAIRLGLGVNAVGAAVSVAPSRGLPRWLPRAARREPPRAESSRGDSGGYAEPAQRHQLSQLRGRIVAAGTLVAATAGTAAGGRFDDHPRRAGSKG